MHILEKTAIEYYAKNLYDTHRAVLSNLDRWERATIATRNTWRKAAENLLNEPYYNNDR